MSAMSTFMANVEVTEGCWNWTGNLSAHGYGRFDSGLFRAHAHRFMFVAMNDIEPEVVRHTCNNRRCVKPTHLIGGTQEQNMRDKFFDGTGNTQKLSPSDVMDIRDRFVRYNKRRSNAREIAAEYGVTAKYVVLIAEGKRLTYVRQDNANHS